MGRLGSRFRNFRTVRHFSGGEETKVTSEKLRRGELRKRVEDIEEMRLLKSEIDEVYVDEYAKKKTAARCIKKQHQKKRSQK